MFVFFSLFPSEVTTGNHHLHLSSASSFLSPAVFMSSLTKMSNLPQGLLFHRYGFWMCSICLSLTSLNSTPKHLTRAVPLMDSFLILCILVTPEENLNVFNTATSSSVSCLLLSPTLSTMQHPPSCTHFLSFLQILSKYYLLISVILRGGSIIL